jgi:hypothetical protein
MKRSLCEDLKRRDVDLCLRCPYRDKQSDQMAEKIILCIPKLSRPVPVVEQRRQFMYYLEKA